MQMQLFIDSLFIFWDAFRRSMEPDSAIVNIYEEEDCIPPHIDHHDFSRPFCTVSLLSQEKIMFGSRLVPEGPGVFHGVNDQHTMIDLPVGAPVQQTTCNSSSEASSPDFTLLVLLHATPLWLQQLEDEHYISGM